MRLVVALVLTLPLLAQPAASRVVEGARRQVGKTRSYDPAYRRIAYPNGDARKYRVAVDLTVSC